MSKIRLSLQQQRNMQNAQGNLPENLEEGIVISKQGKQALVELGSTILICHVKRTVEPVLVGDRVSIIREGLDKGLVLSVHPRHFLLARPDHYKQTKAIAANIDQVIIVVAAFPEPIWFYLDKYLVMAELSGLKVVIVLNKVDLVPTNQMADLEKQIALYQHLSYSVLELVALKPETLGKLREKLQGQTSILIGQSGAGKSALINALTGIQQARTGEVSLANDDKGCHTTSTATLYHLPSGGDLIDSPGIREWGLWDLNKSDLAKGFREFQAYLGQCGFRNCQHDHEKNCGLKQAEALGKFSPGRWQSYLRCRSEMSAD